MENYTKGRIAEEPLDRLKIPFSNIPENFLWMQVNNGSKIRNLIEHALGVVNNDKSKCVLWTGSGIALPKTISCAEILKRKCKISHQITKVAYKKCEEFWEPNIEGLERLVVKREIPVIFILLSFEKVNGEDLGYQSINCKNAFWQTNNSEKFKSNRNKASKISPEDIAKMGLQSGSKKQFYSQKQKKSNPTK